MVKLREPYLNASNSVYLGRNEYGVDRFDEMQRKMDSYKDRIEIVRGAL